MITQPSIIIYDGVCNLCNHALRFVAERDPQKRFVFVANQSDWATALLERHNIHDLAQKTVILLTPSDYFCYSDAVFEIAKELRGYWYIVAYLSKLPRQLCDPAYRFIANNRYRWFGRSEFCQRPAEKFRERFIDCQKDFDAYCRGQNQNRAHGQK